jgi:hypothetical protein
MPSPGAVAVCALVAAEHLSRPRYALLPTPALAFVVVSMSPLRRVAIVADQSVDDSAEQLAFLRLAPLNVSSLAIGPCGSALVARVVAVLQDCQCHSHLTALHFTDRDGSAYDVCATDAAALVKAARCCAIDAALGQRRRHGPHNVTAERSPQCDEVARIVFRRCGRSARAQ